MTQYSSEASPGGVIWTVKLSERDERQLTTAEVIRAFEHKQISPYTMIRKEGGAWTQIGNVPHLVHAISTVVRRRNSTPPPPIAAVAVAAPAQTDSALDDGLRHFSPPPPPASPPPPPPSTPVNLSRRSGQFSANPTPVDYPAVTPHFAGVNERDLPTSPGARNTSTVTPYTVVAPAAIPDDFPPPKRRSSTALLGLLGAGAAAALFLIAQRAGLFPSSAPASAAANQVPIAAAQPEAPAPAPAANTQNPPPASTALAQANAEPIAVLDFDSLPVEGARSPSRSASRAAAASAGSVSLEAARKAMLEEGASAPAPAEQAPDNTAAKSLVAGTAADAPAEPLREPGAFDNVAARSALSSAAQRAQGCLGLGFIHSTGKVVVIFEPSGTVSTVNILNPEFAKPPLGGCLISAFKQATVPPFIGSPTAVSKTFTQ